jgi:hypothetical protein
MYTLFEWDKLFQDAFISLLDVFIQNLFVLLEKST